MKLCFWSVCAAAVAAPLIAVAAGTSVPDEPAHNFVNQDLTWHKPEPRPPGQITVALVDAASARKFGDTAQFDELVLKQVVQHPVVSETKPPPPLTAQLRGSLTRFQVSCGWRTMRIAPDLSLEQKPSDPVVPMSGTGFSREMFPTAASIFYPLVDRICGGLPLGAAQGAKSVDEAIALWKDQFPPPQNPVTNTITVQAVAMRPKEFLPEWTEGERPHRFVPTLTDDTSGNMLFLDRATVVRNGDTVSALSLVVLGGQTERSGSDYDSVVVLRNSHYDCANRTLTVVSQMSWNRENDFIAHSDVPSDKRVADESPVTAADIQAACGDESTVGQSFATKEDAWAFARTRWPPQTLPTWIPCVWNGLPEKSRTQYLSEWKNGASEPQPDSGATVPPYWANAAPKVQEQVYHELHDKLPSIPKPSSSTLSVCGAPNQYFILAAYAMQRGALEMLSMQHIDEIKLRAAWDAIPWLNQERFIHSTRISTVDTLWWRDNVVNSVVQVLGIAPLDSAAHLQVEYYLIGEARLETI